MAKNSSMPIIQQQKQCKENNHNNAYKSYKIRLFSVCFLLLFFGFKFSQLDFFLSLYSLDFRFIYIPVRLLIVIQPNLRPTELSKHKVPVVVFHCQFSTAAGAFYRPCHKSTSSLNLILEYHGDVSASRIFRVGEPIIYYFQVTS